MEKDKVSPPVSCVLSYLCILNFMNKSYSDFAYCELM